jgi:hypothetical protein
VANVESVVKLIAALEAGGIEMIDEGAISNAQGRGVRLNSGGAVACFAPVGSPRRTKPRLGAHEGRNDESRGVRPRSYRFLI